VAGVPNRAKFDPDIVIADSVSASGLTPEQIAAMSPLDVMLHAMRLEIANDKWRVAAALAEKAAPFIHPKLAAETHRVLTDDSHRDSEEIRRELADVDRAAQAASKARTVETGLSERSDEVVH
jgi:alcohol dehydrogenase class IV